MSIFTKVPLKRPKRSRFNLAHSNRMSANFGYLYPFACRKVYPGDRLLGEHQIFLQMATMSSKVYQDFSIRTEYFFVPSRTLWSDFEDFIVGGYDGQQIFTHPYFDYAKILNDQYEHVAATDDTPAYFQLRNNNTTNVCCHGSIFDYFNLPTFPHRTIVSTNNTDYDDYARLYNILVNPDTYQNYSENTHLDFLPIFAFFKVYIDHYADENLQRTVIDRFETMLDEVNSNGGDCTDLALEIARYWALGYFKRNYPKDYFTGALPFVQKGATVNLPFTGSGEVHSYIDSTWYQNNVPLHDSNNPDYVKWLNPVNNGIPLDHFTEVALSASDAGYSETTRTPINQRVYFKNGLTSIDDLRTAVQVQAWLETNARGGTRYNEQILSHFGVRTPDSRLDRAEFVMGTTQSVTLGNVYSTTMSTNGQGITGEPVTVGNSSGHSRLYKKRINEHGYFIAFVSVYPRASYSLGIPRNFLELDKFDYYWPLFQHLGEQSVFNCEVEYGSTNGPLDTWGYNPRYSHEKIALNEVHGDLRDTLRFMTDSRLFHDMPLSEQFIKIDADDNNLNRIFNYQKDDNNEYGCCTLDIYVNLRPSRPMSYFGIPRLIG